MFKKLLIPLATVSTLVGVLTSYEVSTNLLPASPVTTGVASARAEIAPKATVTPTATATPTPSATPSVAPTATIPVSEQYTYKGQESIDDMALLMKTKGKFKSYASDADKLYKVGKCVVSVYAQSINGYYNAADQKAAGAQLIKQYTKTLKLSHVKVKQNYVYSNEAYGTAGKHYKIDTAYSTFTAKAVHGNVSARMFSNGFGLITSTTCPTKTKVPDVHTQLRIKTDIGAPVPQTYGDDHRSVAATTTGTTTTATKTAAK